MSKVFGKINKDIEASSLNIDQIKELFEPLRRNLNKMKPYSICTLNEYIDDHLYGLHFELTDKSFNEICNTAKMSYQKNFDVKTQEIFVRYANRKPKEELSSLSLPAKLLILYELGLIEKINNYKEINNSKKKAELLCGIIGGRPDTVRLYLPINPDKTKQKTTSSIPKHTIVLKNYLTILV